jgi:N-acetylated-alpha-linked acidic dipeptidase
MSLARFAIAFIAAAATGVATTSLTARPDQDRSVVKSGALFGFTAASARAEQELERRFLALPSADRAREYHRFLTSVPHVAGSDRNRALAEWMRDRWKEYGIDEVSIVEHEVLLPWPEEVSVEIAAQSWKARLVEDPIPGDPDTDTGVLHYHAYSRSGEIDAPIVYAASGNPANYDYLASRGIDVRGKIVLVRYSVPYSYRGFKALTAERRGAAGILIYSDPAEDGAGKGAVYPDGPWGNESHLQSGGIPYDFLVPGDPLTPGWASVPGARRIPQEEAISLPKIVSAPLSARDARVILETMKGEEAPREWQGGLGITYRTGPGASVRLRVKLDDRVRAIQTVIGRIRGADLPEEQVVLGNHRDAWIYGGVDPSSGTASMMDLARSLGALVRGGVRPNRSIVLASWDAEEFTLTSSTEWGEQNEQVLRDHAVAYLNVDSSTSGPTFTAAAVPSLNQFIAEAAAAITDPATGLPLPEAKRREQSREQGSLPNASGGALVNNRLGSGSDYTVFLNFIGVPVVDMAFDGPYGVYHSQYDNHQWVERIGDPGFRYHETMTKLWGVMALRLANADALPFDYRPYAGKMREFLAEAETKYSATGAAGLPSRSSPAFAPQASEQRYGEAAFDGNRAKAGSTGAIFEPLRESIGRFEQAAETAAAGQRDALASGDAAALAAVNRRLMRTERAFLDPAGIPGRPWYRHQIYAPKFTYAPELLPAVSEAIDAGDPTRVASGVKQVAAAIDRATATLSGN